MVDVRARSPSLSLPRFYRGATLTTAATLCAALLQAQCAREPAPTALAQLASGSAAGFNVLLITLDTTRADRLGAYGYAGAATPVLDELAAGGIRFADAVTVVPLTLPSHSTMLTGLYPPNHGVRTNGRDALADEHTTLAEILKQAGYQTGAFVASFVLDPRYGLSQGFDRYDARVDPTLGDAYGGSNERSATDVTTAALDWLQERDPARPFFAWVHYFDPHHAYAPRLEYAIRFADRPYDGEIAYVDSEVGRLLRALGERDLTERTLIVVAGDHGESLGEHGERFHGRTLYESVMRVPLILAAPGLIREGGVVDEAVVSVVDIFPTVLELLGRDVPATVDGTSLLQAGADPGRMVYMETLTTYLDGGWAPLYAIRSHGRKYVDAPRPEYYELDADPGELVNRDANLPPDRAPLVAYLDELTDRWPSLERVAAASSPIDAEARSRLLSLGYVSSLVLDAAGGLADPKDVLPAHELMVEAEALTRSGDHERALARVQEALEIVPQSREALHRLGELYALTNRQDEAERALRRSLEIQMNAPGATLLAQVLTRGGRYAEASALLDQAADLDPDHGGIYIARADILAFQGRFAEALTLYEKAVEVDPYRAVGIVRTRMAALQRRLAQIEGASSRAPRP
jgi:arylsulfatase A-like enzyme